MMDTNEQLQNLLSGMSTSIRNALSAAFSAALRMNDVLEGRGLTEAENCLAVMQHSQFCTLRMAENMEDALISGSHVLNLETVEINALCRNLIDTISILTVRRGIHLRFETRCTTVLLQVDYARIERMLLNILGNSLKYTPADGEISLLLTRDEDNVMFTIRDSGSGLSQTDYDCLFCGYTRPVALDDPNRGAGFGMAAAAGIARLHGGNIIAENHEGDGLIVHISLPDRRDADMLHVRYEPLQYGEEPMRRVLTTLADVLSTEEYTKYFMD